MNRIDTRFAELRTANRKALIPFITAGDPSLDATVPVMNALVAAGADVIELGVPFSDPMADGPTIQRSSERALARGVGTTMVFEMVRAFRATDATTPVVLMGYLNPVVIRGIERYASDARAAGVDGVLLVDLPPEEAAETRAVFNAQGLALIALAAPTTSEPRLARLAREAQGYLYYVSFAGVTGAHRIDTGSVLKRVAALRSQAAAPVVVGFGVRDASTAATLAPCADGVVVGSALVEAIAEVADVDDAARRATAFLAPLRAALDAA
ncbi:MAG TPA: tryptophan synthase subunit alpha [Xanthomonadaceae bacterium]|nr:tryptophan synthase subunit alpha [Xanthomonadaceae bacterium]